METAFPAAWTVRRARDAYLEENGFSLESYEAKWTPASFFGLPLRIPNTRRHRWAIMLHDLHHVATGFGTDLAGEGEISAWELRAGTAKIGAYVASIIVAVAANGVMLAPRRVLRAWRDAAPARSLFALLSLEDERAYGELLALDVGTLRARLGLPEDGVAHGPRRLHDFAPRTVSPPREQPPPVGLRPARGPLPTARSRFS